MNETSVLREAYITKHPELAAFATGKNQYAVQSSTKQSEGHLTTHNGTYATACTCKHGSTAGAKGTCWHMARTNEELAYTHDKSAQTRVRQIRQEDDAIASVADLFNPDLIPLKGNRPFGLLK